MRAAVVLVALAFCGLAFAAVDFTDLPQFPQLVEVSSAVEGPDNNILTGAPLKVPVIDDPFKEDPGVDPAQELERIERVFHYEPPAAASPKAIAPDQVDILEVLDRAAVEAKKRAAKKAAKKAAREAKAAGVLPQAHNENNRHQMKLMNSEIGKLNQLITKATKVQAALPQKKAKLESLQKKLRKAAAAAKKGSKVAKKGPKVDKQAQELAAKLKTLKSKLAGLESAKKLLHKSIHGLKKAQAKKAEAAKKNGGKAPAAEAEAAPAADAAAAAAPAADGAAAAAPAADAAAAAF